MQIEIMGTGESLSYFYSVHAGSYEVNIQLLILCLVFLTSVRRPKTFSSSQFSIVIRNCLSSIQPKHGRNPSSLSNENVTRRWIIGIRRNARKNSACCRVLANEYSCAHGAQINFGDLNPYLTYGHRCFMLYWILIGQLSGFSVMPILRALPIHNRILCKCGKQEQR